MKSVFVCAFLLALAKYGFAVKVCNQDVPSTTALTPSCAGNNNMLKYPNYQDPSTFYTCTNGVPQLQDCPPNQYFCYYRQKCGDCSEFIPPPECGFFTQRTGSKCTGGQPTVPPTTTTARTIVTKPPITKPTTSAGPTSAKPTLRPPTTKAPIPTPPSQQTTTKSAIPMPPMVVTPVPGIPTPPSENETPLSIPGTPPMITSLPAL